MATLKKAWLSAIATIALITVISITFAFTNKDGNRKRTTAYFEYAGTSYTDNDYRNPSNWNYTTSPSDCPGDGHICVLQIDASNLTGSGSMVDKLNRYFQSLSSPNEVKNFVETPANIAYEKL